MNNEKVEEIGFNLIGVVNVQLKEDVVKIPTLCLKTTLNRISAVNTLRRLGQSVKNKVKDDDILKCLVENISGDIVVLSYEIHKK